MRSANRFVVDTRPGAGSLVALDILASAAPDGYTLMGVGKYYGGLSAALQIALRHRARFCTGGKAKRTRVRAGYSPLAAGEFGD